MPSTRHSYRTTRQTFIDADEPSSFSILSKPGEATNPPLSKLSTLCVLFIIPMLFGGVHPPVYWGLYSIFFTLGVASLVRRGRSLNVSSLSKQYTLCIVYLIAQGIVYGLWPVAHPIIGTASFVANWDQYITALFSLIVFAATIVYFNDLFQQKHSTRSFTLSLFPVSLLLISLIALAHWFTDNGKLFWVFKPDTIISSERARWPFVSPNNLAQFLVLLIFPTIAAFFISLEEFTRLVVQIAQRRAVRIADLLQIPRVQSLILRTGLSAVSFLAGILTLLATQSRATWIGAAIGIGVLVIGWYSSLHKWTTELPKSQVTINKTPLLRYIILIRKTLPFISGLCFLSLVILFLEGHGKELIVDRMNYGFVAAIDDLRWQIYKDTLPMIRENFFFGVGLGNWQQHFGHYASPELGNLNPVYAHSDPLQFFAETGIFGVGLALLTAVTFLNIARRICAKASDAKSAMYSFSFVCAVGALFIASSFDFPFRLPAISFLLALEIALLLSSPVQNKV